MHFILPILIEDLCNVIYRSLPTFPPTWVEKLCVAMVKDGVRALVVICRLACHQVCHLRLYCSFWVSIGSVRRCEEEEAGSALRAVAAL